MSQSVLSGSHIAKLERLIFTARSGLLKISVGGKDAIFCLEKGQIGSIFYRGEQNLAALSRFCQDLQDHSGLVKSQFDAAPVSGNEPFLALTETVLRRLKGHGQHVTQTDTATDSGHLAPIPGVLLNPTLERIIENTFEKPMGAVSAQICSDVFQTTRQLRIAVEALASELSNPVQAQAFRDSVRTQIAALPSSELSFGADEFSKAEINAAAKAGVELTDSIRVMLEELLPRFVGQRAPTICREVFANTTTLRAAIDYIGEEIGDSSATVQFKELVRKRLNIIDNHGNAA